MQIIAGCLLLAGYLITGIGLAHWYCKDKKYKKHESEKFMNDFFGTIMMYPLILLIAGCILIPEYLEGMIKIPEVYLEEDE